MAADRAHLTAMAVGAIGAALVLGACLVLDAAAPRAWLAAAALLAMAPGGAVLLLLMLRLIPGVWRSLQTPLLSLAGLWAPAALAMAVALIWPGAIYGWIGHAGPGAFRQVYLTPWSFALRGLLWFALLALLGRSARKGLGEGVAAAGLIGLVLLSELIWTDWLGSLDAFAGSGLGLYVMSISINLALALAIFDVARRVDERGRDILGGVMLTSLALWAYLGFMAYFIVWSENLPAGVEWYLRRGGGWALLAFAAIALRSLSGLLLLDGRARRSPRILRAICLCQALAAAPEAAWLILPARGTGAAAGPRELVLDLAALVFLAALGWGVLGWRRP